MPIYLTRHGESDHNVAGVFAGSQIDSSLTQSGKAEVLTRAKTIAKDCPIDVVVMSEMARSQQTGRIIAQEVERLQGHRIELMTTPLLNEVDVGKFSGHSAQEAATIDGQALTAFNTGEPVEWDFPEGENFEGVFSRCHELLRRLSIDESKGILVVGHAMVNRVLLMASGNEDNAGFSYSLVVQL